MPAVHAAILGVVQGITEFLPVSSTAHLLILGQVLGYDDPGGVFTVMIQLGSILAVMWLYRTRLRDVAAGLASRPEARHFAIVVIVGSLPTLIAGALLADFIRGVLYDSAGAIGAAFILGGVVMLLIERFRPAAAIPDIDRVSVARALGVGLCQMLALIPGVSRSGATIIGGLVMGLDRRAAAEFSFFLAMPTMAAAFVHDLLGVRDYLTTDRAVEIGIGFVTACLASVVVVKPFLAVVGRSGFAPFAFYRIALGLLLLAALVAGWSLK